ncbi:S8 family serine peptidase [Halovivax limisalsi]|uniref:S8 family serine peptidase n=1 Tax=Halovivax limisalsi TaxID=1453760 RepID=UPI001FFC360D|nr:S8 family serine peptidase [Halovivax limisalsi]
MYFALNRRLFLIVLVAAVLLSVGAGVGAGLSVPSDQASGEPTSDGASGDVRTALQTTGDGDGPTKIATTAVDETGGTVTSAIDESVRNATGEIEVIVRFESADRARVQASDDAAATLERAASETQAPFETVAARTEGVSVEKSFWLANAALVTVDTDRVALESLATIDGVERIHRNYVLEGASAIGSESKATPPGPIGEGTGPAASSGGDASATPTATHDGGTTYGLDQINVPQAWDEFDTQGEGATVAILDSGVDVENHPELELAGWYDPINHRGEPYDDNGHGTHVTGTVGGHAKWTGTHYGVAPDVELLHGKVLGADGSGTWDVWVEAMQWATTHESGVDAISLSMGQDNAYRSDLIEPIRNANDVGIIVVAASMNEGEGTSGSPGNLYNTLAVGASDRSADIAGFSGGETVQKSNFHDAPTGWPDSWIVPDVAAPGSAVVSTAAGGGYEKLWGTSMATPHVAGVVALMQSVTEEDLDPADYREALIASAWKPDDAPDEKDIRYGHGIIDAYAAVDAVVNGSTVTGTVTGPEGDPLPDATVAVDDGETVRSVTTNATGQYELFATSGNRTLTAEAFGHGTNSTDVDVAENTSLSVDFALESGFDAAVSESQPEAVEAGANVTATVDVNAATELVVNATGSLAEDGLDLVVGGESASFGQPVSIPNGAETVTITVETPYDQTGELRLDHTFRGNGETLAVATGPTAVKAEFTSIAVVDTDRTYGGVVSRAIEDQLPANAAIRPTVRADVDHSSRPVDVYVVQKLGDGTAEPFINATNESDIGVVYLDQYWGANGIKKYADVTNDPEDTMAGWTNETVETVSYVVRSEHELFSGYDVGSRVPVADGWGSYSAFDNTSMNVLATVATESESSLGSGLAIDENTNTILAASLGLGPDTEFGSYTTEGAKLLANAVSAVEPEDPAFSGTVEIGGSPAPEGTTVEALIDGEVRGTTTVTSPGEYGTDGGLAVAGGPSTEGKRIAFEVDGMVAGENATWRQGASTELNLTVTGNASVAGTVIGDRTNAMISNATVAASGPYGTVTAETGSDGTFRIDERFPGEYSVTIDAPGYETVTRTVDLANGATATVNATLKGSATIEGRVIDAAAADAIANATLTVSASGTETPLANVTANATGAVVIDSIPAAGASYSIAVDATGYERANRTVSVDETNVTLDPLSLPGTASLGGCVETAAGESLPGVRIDAADGTGLAYETETGEGGDYRFDAVRGANRTYAVSFERAGFAANETTVANVSGSVADVNATLTQRAHYFALANLSAPGSVDAGDTVGLSATVSNPGSEDWNETVSLLVDGSEATSRNVSLNATDSVQRNENTTVTFSHEPDSAGNLTYTVATPNETANATVTVEESGGGGPALPPPPPESEPSLSIASVDLDAAEIEAGEAVAVSVVVANDGDAAGERTLELALDGSVVATTELSVPAGEETTATLSHVIEEPGEYDLAVAGEVVATVTVSEPGSPDGESDGEDGTSEDGTGGSDGVGDGGSDGNASGSSDDGSTDDESAADATAGGDGVPGFSPVAALVAIVLASALARRR